MLYVYDIQYVPCRIYTKRSSHRHSSINQNLVIIAVFLTRVNLLRFVRMQEKRNEQYSFGSPILSFQVLHHPCRLLSVRGQCNFIVITVFIKTYNTVYKACRHNYQSSLCKLKLVSDVAKNFSFQSSTKKSSQIKLLQGFSDKTLNEGKQENEFILFPFGLHKVS